MLSIIIPVLNEASTIIDLLQHLVNRSTPANIADLIIVDGASIDNTVHLIESYAENQSALKIKVVQSEKGRAKQMNAGAAIASGKVLYFLHADSFPPAQFDQHILNEVKKGNPAGCFCMRFDSNHWWLRMAGWFTRFSWRASRGGDQSQFITKSLFNEIGGYDERYVIYEDNILINALYARNKYVVIPHWLTSSARLYEEKGVWYVQYHFLKIYIKRWQGADASQLYAYYNAHIRQRMQSSCEDQKKSSEAFAE
ncbi:MAG TPA: glycosyltransferase [Leeuwenhoekiella sp.]|nr:glycosyltransferase [Leeuwenhoekiella sp.]